MHVKMLRLVIRLLANFSNSDCSCNITRSLWLLSSLCWWWYSLTQGLELHCTGASRKLGPWLEAPTGQITYLKDNVQYELRPEILIKIVFFEHGFCSHHQTKVFGWTTKKTFSQTHRIVNNGNIGRTGFTTWKQKYPTTKCCPSEHWTQAFTSSLSHRGMCYLEEIRWVHGHALLVLTNDLNHRLKWWSSICLNRLERRVSDHKWLRF